MIGLNHIVFRSVKARGYLGAAIIGISASLPACAGSPGQYQTQSLEAFQGWTRILPPDEAQEICLRPTKYDAPEYGKPDNHFNSTAFCADPITVFDLFQSGSFFVILRFQDENTVEISFVDLSGYQSGHSRKCPTGVKTAFNADPTFERVPGDIITITREALVECNDRKIRITQRDSFFQGGEIGHFLPGYGPNTNGGIRLGIVRRNIDIEF